MNIGLFLNALCDHTLNDALNYAKSIGIEEVEIPCGGLSGAVHCNPQDLLADEAKFLDFQNTIKNSGLKVSALTCHGNPIHPNQKVAQKYDSELRNAVLLAERMGVKTVVTFSGCPGVGESSMYPTWCIAVWPFDNIPITKYQWDEVVIPYWKEFAPFAEAHHVRIAIEMYAGFSVYNPRTLLRLRDAVGSPAIGANFDPGNLIWQGISPPAAIRRLRGAIYHVHAKDCYVDPQILGRTGFFDPWLENNEVDRPYSFRIPGSATSASEWKEMVIALRESGYDGALSIEHEDRSIGQKEGLLRSVAFLKDVILRDEPTGCPWYAAIQPYEEAFLPEEGG